MCSSDLRGIQKAVDKIVDELHKMAEKVNDDDDKEITEVATIASNNNKEIGAKWDINPALMFSAAMFRLDRQNTPIRDATGIVIAAGASRVEGIELGLAGKVTEGPASCLFMVRDGVFVTPSLTSGVLESITRTALIRLAREELGMQVQEREIDRTELYVADEMFFCGTGAELMPIGSIDHFQVGSGGVGPLTARLERVFHDVVRGIHPEYGHWRRHIDHGYALGGLAGGARGRPQHHRPHG